MRDSTIFYRSFYEAINLIPEEDQIKVYKAIFEYSLNHEEIELIGTQKAVFTLIKPQLDANQKRYENGAKGGKPKQKKTKTKPKANQDVTKPEPNANVNKNVNDNVNVNDNKKEIEKTHPLQKFVFDNLEKVKKIEKQLTFDECEKLISKYSKQKIVETLYSLENYKKARGNYVSVYLTLSKWLSKDEEREKEKSSAKKEKPTNVDNVMGPRKKEFYELYGIETNEESVSPNGVDYPNLTPEQMEAIGFEPIKKIN